MLYFSTWKTTLVAVVLLIGALFAMPNLFTVDGRESIPGFLPHRAINLGLDLRGGSHLLYEVDLSQVRRNELEGAIERAAVIARDDACTDAGAPRAGLFCPVLAGQQLFEDYATLRVQNPADFEEVLRRLRAELPLPNTNAVTAALTGQTRLFNVTQGGAPGEIRIEVTDESLAEVRTRTISQSIEIIRRRVDATGTTEPIIQRQGSDRILVQAPGEQDPEALKRVIGQTAQMTFHIVASANPIDIQRALDGRPPPTQELLPTDDPAEPYLLVERRLDIADTTRGPDGSLVRVLSGQYLRNASQGFLPQGNEAVVNFTFNTTGAVIFSKLTTNHVRERFAVVLDGRVITAPEIRGPITGGSGYIEGSFTIESASELASLLNAGALPAPLTIVEERVVGASLGADSVEMGTFALVVGFIAIVVFMVVAYRLLGVFANLALITNLILIAGALSGLQATLTLPGIGGIILTIGMAVDANVLIFERIKEEVGLGRTPANAIEAGYTQAFSAIFDANVTTLIAALLLFWFGTGPIRGFAATLGIGVVTSMFTAYMVSRLLVAAWFRATRPRVITI